MKARQADVQEAMDDLIVRGLVREAGKRWDPETGKFVPIYVATGKNWDGDHAGIEPGRGAGGSRRDWRRGAGREGGA
jgi:hypothetical protein